MHTLLGRYCREMAMHYNVVGAIVLLGYISSSDGDCSINTPDVKTFGSECQYMCHCKNGASCNNVTGECSDRCDTNWFGPACQYRDMAENGHIVTHSGSEDGGSYYANDGNTSTCSYTTEPSQSNTKPWWRVKFRQVIPIRDVYILTKNDQLAYFPGFEVTVDNIRYFQPTIKETCYQHDNTVPGSRHIHVQCYKPVYGNQVTITLSKVRAQLVLCDVRLSAGRNFAFRKPVTTSQYDYNYPPFNAVDGKLGAKDRRRGCFVSLTEGHIYFHINLGHSINTYSININSSYYEEGLTIYTISASTQTDYFFDKLEPPSPGNPHKIFSARVQQLSIQTYRELILCEVQIFGECLANKCGFDCSEDCYCKSFEGIGQRISGVCTSGCQNGWTGTAGKCNIECGDKKWGKQCQYDCGACRNGTCDFVSGKCAGGCQDGYQELDDCKTECGDKKWGKQCQYDCGACRNGTCDFVSGKCAGGCQDGYQDTDDCKTECGDKKWGKQCQYDCGACRNGTCDFVSGKCAGGCQDDYQDTDDCKTEVCIQPNTFATFVGSAVKEIVIIGVAIVLIVLVCIFLYRRRQPSSVVITNPESHGDISNNPTSVSFRDPQSNDSTNDKEGTNKEPINQKTINHGKIQENFGTPV